jgi:hypothetical protein
MTTKTNKILGAVVAIAIVCSVIVLVYVNQPKSPSSKPENNNEHPPSTVVTLIYDDQHRNFTIANLATIGPYTARGGYLTKAGVIKGVGNYTGVNISALVRTLNPAPPSFNLTVYSEDGSNTTYNFSEILGKVKVYDPKNATPIGNGHMAMVLAYEFEGRPLNESSDGTFKIAFLDDTGSITQASLWWKKVISIQVTT